MDFLLEKRYLCFPIKCGAKPVKTRLILPDYTIVVSLELTREEPDFWVYYDALFTMGQTIRILHEGEKDDLRAENTCVFRDRPIEKTPIYREEHRPRYHFTNARGWINDPNGLLYKDGTYHMFYQLNNYGSRWYDKGWGHAKSTNLFDWEILPPALYADDSGYAISGSALFDPDNRAGFGKDTWILMYSSRYGGEPEKGQFQNIAYSADGRIFRKYSGNPIIKDTATINFRDPKVFWHEPSGHFVMVLACGEEIRFYRSLDLKNWDLSSVLEDTLINPQHKVYECPELMEYQIEGENNTRWVLSVSIDGFRRVLHIIGDFDGRSFVYDPSQKLQWADYGKDFYAAVAWNPQYEMAGRKLWIGWMCFWPYARECPKLEGWMGAFTVPRELRLVRHENGKLYIHQNPAKEIEELKQEAINTKNQVALPSNTAYRLPGGEAFSLNLELNKQDGETGNADILLHYESGETVTIHLDFLQNLLQMDRSDCNRIKLGSWFTEPLTAPLSNRNTIQIQLLIDKGSIELFLYDGRTCLTALCFPEKHSCSLEFYNYCENEIILNNITLNPIRRAKWTY
ncbi:MAG TPA: hypothetical protein DDY59_02405 [Lachnospiraceae bacterium]|jgi:fructan beta-fructosidase|nr:hypothetical protein [Lachnospiraceae bacterium]